MTHAAYTAGSSSPSTRKKRKNGLDASRSSRGKISRFRLTRSSVGVLLHTTGGGSSGTVAASAAAPASSSSARHISPALRAASRAAGTPLFDSARLISVVRLPARATQRRLAFPAAIKRRERGQVGGRGEIAELRRCPARRRCAALRGAHGRRRIGRRTRMKRAARCTSSDLRARISSKATSGARCSMALVVRQVRHPLPADRLGRGLAVRVGALLRADVGLPPLLPRHAIHVGPHQHGDAGPRRSLRRGPPRSLHSSHICATFS